MKNSIVPQSDKVKDNLPLKNTQRKRGKNNFESLLQVNQVSVPAFSMDYPTITNRTIFLGQALSALFVFLYVCGCQFFSFRGREHLHVLNWGIIKNTFFVFSIKTWFLFLNFACHSRDIQTVEIFIKNFSIKQMTPFFMTSSKN